MNTTTFYKTAFFVSLFLLLVTLSAFITFLLKQDPATDINDETAYGRGFAHFRNSAGFDSRQQEEYKLFLNEYRASIQSEQSKLREKQSTMFEIMAGENPDTVVLNQISIEASQLQHQIRLQTFRHLMKVRELANDQQRKGLQVLYREMLQESRHPNSQAGKGRNRMRHGR
jgi:hypothetical protein